MNYKYILKEIKRANKNIIKAYNSLNYYKVKKDKKYYDYTEWYITEVNEILTNLEIDLNTRLENNDEQLQ